MKYEFIVTETIQKTIEVEARDKDEAFDIIEEMVLTDQAEMYHNFDSCETEWILKS